MNTAAIDSLLHWLLRTSIEASLLILAVLGLRLMLGTRLTPAWRIGLWMLVGAKLMLPAFIPAGFGLGSLWQDKSDLSNTNAIVIAADPSASSVTSAVEIHTSAASPPPISHSSFDLRHSALAAWFLGAFSVLGIAIIQQVRFNAFLRRRPRASAPLLRTLVASLSHKAGIKKSVNIVLMPSGTTPAMVGIRQPKLLLPEDWDTRFDERSLKHVVLHELLHVRQHDLLWNWAATAVQALHWFNPLVWFVVSRFQADRELRCDAGALAILAPSERLDYGHTLLRIQETFFAPPAIAGLAPCVRNHPTLRQRILMIATPTTRQPWLHALLVLTLSVLIGYSFTTARAAEKEVPPKVREEESNTKPSTEPSGKGESNKKPAMKEDGEREDGGKPSTEREGNRKPSTEDNGRKKSGDREGEGRTKKSGMRDGERPRAGQGDGERPRSGKRDGERAKTGPRDGEKPRTGERDGEGGKKSGARDGEESNKPRKGARDGEGNVKVRRGEGDAATSSGETITLRVSKDGDQVMVGDEEVAMSSLRSHLSTFLPEHPGAKVIVTGDPDTPLKALHNTVDAVRDNGNKNVGIKAE